MFLVYHKRLLVPLSVLNGTRGTGGWGVKARRHVILCSGVYSQVQFEHTITEYVAFMTMDRSPIQTLRL